MKFNPENILEFTFNITNVPPFPKKLNEIMRSRTDEKAVAIQTKYKNEFKEYEEWLDQAKWYYAFKGYKGGRMPDSIVEEFTKISHGLVHTASLLAAFNKIKRYYRKNRKR